MSLQELLAESTKGLPPEAMKEIVAFALYVRKKVFDPEAIESEVFSEMVRQDLAHLSSQSAAQIEAKAADYQNRYPNE